jgi:hypothetical protein
MKIYQMQKFITSIFLMQNIKKYLILEDFNIWTIKKIGLDIFGYL